MSPRGTPIPVPEVAAAIARARRAQPAWGELPARERVATIARFRQGLFARRREVAQLISDESGKPMAEALVAEVVTVLDLARFVERTAPRLLAPESMGSATLALWRKRLSIAREPYGVLGIIAPWNYPFMLPAGHVLAGLATGNAVVLKPSELTPRCGALLGDLFAAAGLPAGTLEVVQGAGAVGQALVEGDVDKVFFTGSVATGRRVAARCGERLVPCTLELGGSDPAIVLEDADVHQAARGILWGRFANAGQTCVATKRVFVVASVHDALVAALEEQGARLRLRGPDEDTWDVGALIRPEAVAGLAAMRDEAGASGARVVPLTASSSLPGTMVPTLLLGVAPGATCLREETFGPLLPVVAVPDEAAAVAAANASPFGLSASVWSRSRRRARRVAMQLQAGTVALNDVALVAGVAEVPHGGVKASGFGRAHGVAGLEECLRTRTVVDDIFPSVPQPWWFPYGTGMAAMLDGYARLAHGRSLTERLSGLLPSIRLMFRR